MASTSRGKRSRSGRGAAPRGGVKRATGGAKKARARAAGGGRTARSAPSNAKARNAASARKPARPAGKASATGGTSGAEVTKLKARFEREKSGLERRLTETVREIGQLRHHEARVGQLERQLKERDDTIAQLRGQLNELRNRPSAPLDDPEVQPSLALGERAPRDLDDFDDDISLDDEDDDLV